jgi:hypothetical protein
VAEPDLRSLADRIEIQDLLTRYATAIDTGEWDLLDEVFTPDATLDYTTSGGIKGGFEDIKRWLAEVLPMFTVRQHLVTNHHITVDGDRATSESYLFNPMVLPVKDSERVVMVGAGYRDQLIRTPNGWRIADRLELHGWSHNWPGAKDGSEPLQAEN